jgi:hypothetical protein
MTVNATTGYYEWQMDKLYQTELDDGLKLNFIVIKADEFSRSESGCYTGKRWYDSIDQCTNQAFTPYIGPYLTLTKQVSADPAINPVVLDPATHMIVNYELQSRPDGFNAYVDYRKLGEQNWVRQKEDNGFWFSSDWGKVHHITLSGLEPNTQYEYRVLGPDDAATVTYKFKTASMSADHSRFLVVGDMQDENRSNGQRWADVADAIVADHLDDFDFIITVGDMVKDDISENGDRFHWWKVYFDKGHTLFAQKPMLPAMGNHDTPGVPSLSSKEPHNNWDEPYWSNAEDTRAFRKYFYMNPDMAFRDYYSYQYGNACFISANSEIPVFYGRHPERDDAGDRERDHETWLEAEVNQAEACDWSFGYWHVPAINPAGGKDEVSYLRQYVGYFNNKLDWVITGHVHEYQRVKPVEATAQQLLFDKSGYGRRATEGVGYLIAPPAGQYPRNNQSNDMDQLAFYPHNSNGVAYEIGFSLVNVSGLEFDLKTYGMGGVGDRVQPSGYRSNDDRTKQLLEQVRYDKSQVQFKKVFENVDFRGTPNSWNKTAMKLVADYTWEIEVTVSAVDSNPRFKLYANSKWYGDDNNDFETNSSEKSDIQLDLGAGTYRIQFIENTRKYSITKL